MAANADPYIELQRVARRRGQRGHFTSAQAEFAGMSRTKLSRLVARGLVLRAAPRVYRFKIGAAPTWKDDLAVELLSTGGLACGLSASALYDLADPPNAPDVLVFRGSRTRGRGRHTTRELPSYECVIVDGLRSLSPMRAILDSVHRISRNDAVALVESAIVRRLVKPIALGRRATELSNAKRPGCAVTLSILADLHPELSLSRNKWEALVARRAKQCGLALPRLEYELSFGGRRYFVDAGWLRFAITASALRNRDDRAFQQVARAVNRRTAADVRGATRAAHA